jgi:hypothetical protein
MSNTNMEIALRIEDLTDYIFQIYEAGKKSLLLVGEPGIGKTTAVQEASKRIAQEQNKRFILYEEDFAEQVIKSPNDFFVLVDLNPNHLEPADLTGIPQNIDNRISYIPLSWSKVISKASGILFMDELTNVQRPDVMSATFRITQDKASGFTRFSPETMVVAAGNDPLSSSMANLLPAPLINRFIVCEVKPPSLEGWINWMNKHCPQWDKRVLAYLKQFPSELLQKTFEAESLQNFATPRSWTELAVILSKTKASSWFQTSIGLLGKEIGTKFHSLLSTSIPDIEELIDNPDLFTGLDLNGKYLTAIFLAEYMIKDGEQDFQKTIPLSEKMAEDNQDFVVLTIMACSDEDKRQNIILALARESSIIKEILKDIAQLREKLDNNL